MLRETVTPPAAEKRRTAVLAFGPFTFDRTGRMLRHGNELVSLPPRALAVLEILLGRAGDVVPRQEIIDAVWKDAFVTDTSLAEAVSFLRQTLGDDPQSPTFIQTVHRRGYRFIAPVAVQAAPADHATPAVVETTRPPAISPSISGQLVPWSIAALCLATTAAALWHVAAARVVTPPMVRFEITVPEGTRFDTRAPALAFAPGGTHLAWAGCDEATCRLYVRPLDRTEPTPLTGTEDAAAPFFSPDGGWIGYFANGKVWKVPVGGGTPISVADAADALGATWTADNRIIFAGARLGLSIVDANGGQPRALTTPRADAGEVRHAWPAITADGAALLFTVVASPSGGGGRIAAMGIADGSGVPPWKSILDGATRAQVVRREAILFSRGGELAAIGFDPVRLGVSGAAQPVISGVSAAASAGNFTVSAAGALAYVTDETPAAGRPRFTVSVASPDGARVAAAAGEEMRTDIWVASLENGAARRLTHDGVNGAPVWTADSRTVYFARRVSGAFELWKRDADASAAAARVFAAPGHVIPLSCSPNGTLLFSRATTDSGLDVWMMPATGGAPRPVVESPFDETAAELSPDGRFVAYQSNESGRWDVHALRLEDGRRAVVSADGGVAPRWERDGLRIRYRAGNKTMVAALVPGDDLRVLPAAEITTPDVAEHLGVEAGGRLRFDATPPVLRRSIIALAFDRELRHILGPPAGPMPR